MIVRRITLTLYVALAVSVLALPAIAAGTPRTHVVARILVDGRPVESTNGVTVVRGNLTQRMLR